METLDGWRRTNGKCKGNETLPSRDWPHDRKVLNENKERAGESTGRHRRSRMRDDADRTPGFVEGARVLVSGETVGRH
jgi:hypothetical protein